MSLIPAEEHLAFLVQNIKEDRLDNLILLRGSLEASLLKLGHDPETVNEVLNDYYKRHRTLH